jgi:hypothetical protein|tara:strand:- start:796 stop:3618 length:2823 start_codon:yes stop_codon:yes gene_type:complete
MGTERDFKVKKGLKVEGGDITVASGNSVLAPTFDTNVTSAGVTLSGTTLAADGTDANININITPKNNGNVVIDGAVELGHASDTTIARASSGVISVEGSNVIMASNDVSALTDSTSAAIGIGTIELGHASDTTIARTSGGVVTIAGAEIRTGTVPVNKGGTGATSLTNGGVLLGSGTGAITAMGVLGNGQMIVGDGTTDPVAESGATLRTSIGVGTGDSPTFTNLTLSGDLTLDDGGSLKEAGGTAAFTFDGSGHITKLGQSSPSTNDVLKYDGAKWVAGAAASGADGMGTGFTVSATTDSNATTITQGDDLFFAASGGLTAETTADGTVTHSLDINGLSAAAIASGDFLAFSDENASGDPTKKESIDDIATLFAGTGLTASSAVISVDAAQSQITSVGALTGLSTAADATIDLNGGAITVDGTTLSIDSTDTTNLTMTANSSSGKTLTIDAANSGSGAASIAIGTTSGTSISMGHSTSTVTVNDNLVVTGDLTINGATTTISTTNSVVEDSLIELNTGATSNSNDLGFIFERGSTGNNAAIIWDESEDKFTMGTTTGIGTDSTVSVTAGTLVTNIEGNLTGTIQTASQTNITGIGTITTGTWNATDIAIAHGGTGASTDSAARTNLGLAIGSDVQAHDAQLDAIAALATTDGGVIIGNGSTFVLESGVTLRNSLNLGTGDSPRFTGIELGAPADTTITRVSAGDIQIEDNIVYRAGGTNVAIADGGTNADNVSDARDNLGLTIGTNVQAYDAQLATLAGYTSTQIGFLNVSTAGTVEASKAVVVDADKDAESFRNLTATGTLKSDGMQLTGGANSAADSGTVVAEFDVSEAQVATNSAATIASYAFGTYRTAKFLVQIGRVDASEQFDCMEILVTYDGGSAPSGDSDIFMTTYGYITTGASDLGTFNAVKGSSTIDLQFTPATSGGTYEYRVIKSLLIR